MKVEYRSKLHPVSEVLQQFGPNSYMKPSEMNVPKFTHLWQEQLPECMKPNNEIAELRKFADLIKRVLYCFCLKDQYLHKELNKLDEDDANFKKYFDQALVAEQKRKSLQEIGQGAAALDPCGGISISKMDTSGRSGNYGKFGGSNSHNNNGSSSHNNGSGSSHQGV